MPKFKKITGKINNSIRESIYMDFNEFQASIKKLGISYAQRYSEPRKGGYTCKWYCVSGLDKKNAKRLEQITNRMAWNTKLDFTEDMWGVESIRLTIKE